MGAFIIFDIEFATKQDRKRFERLAIPKILVDEYSNSNGFSAWAFNRNMYLNPIYFMGFMGYAEPKDYLKECKKKKIKVKHLSWIPINDKNSKWVIEK